MRALILVCMAGSLGLACGSGSKDGGSGRNTPAQSNLTITTSGNGVVRGAGTDCRGSCRAQLTVGSPVHLMAVPDSGSSFVGWAGSCSGSDACDLMLDVDRDVSATFAATQPPPPQGKHRLVVVVQGEGRVTSSPPGLDCDSATCTAEFDSGASVTLTAIAANGFNFSCWGTDCSGPAGCTVTLSKEATVFANFVKKTPPPPAQVHLTAAVSGPGTVTGAGLSCGQSAATCDVMVVGGSTVTLTANAAAAGTRFIGWGGACSGGSTTCQLTLQADTRVTAQFQSEVVVLAPSDGTNGQLIALNSTHVFWSRFVSGSSGIWSVPKEGGEAVKLATGGVGAMAADDAFLYWTDGSRIFSTPVGGGEVALIATGFVIGKLALDEVGALYWTSNSPTGVEPGSVHRMQNRADTVLANVTGPTGGIAVDATDVYFTQARIDGTVQRVSRKGGPPEVLFSCSNCFPRVVRVDSQFVYSRASVFAPPTASGHVQVWSKADGSLRVISGGNGNGWEPRTSFSDWDVDVSGFVAYWNWTRGEVDRPFGIFRANADGTGFAAVVTDQALSWGAIRVDDVAIYYEHGGAIIRRLK